ncbi:MAG: APC family permease [Candidatus Hodarchaeales archaeon]|jgi:amino acid transporter
MSESKTYVRDATGLVREIGVITATIFIISNVVGLGWQKRVFQTTGWNPLHPDDYFLGLPIDPLVMAFLLTGIGAIATVFVFAVMATAMPRAGGGYVYISRTISPGVGFTAAWAEFLGIALSYGLIAVAVIELVVTFFPLAVPDLMDLWDLLAEPWWLFVLGVFFTFLFAGIAFFGTSMTGKILHLMFWIPAAITVGTYIFLLLGAFDPDSVTAGITTLTEHTPNEWIDEAIAQGINDARAPNYFAAVNTAIVGAYWSWIGYAAISFAAGEVKEANRSLPIAHIAAGFIILFIYMSVSLLMSWAASVGTHASGWTFMQALGFLDHGAGSATTSADFNKYGWMPFIAMFTAEGLGFGFFAVFAALAGVFWLANDLPPFIITSSRLLFAMSFDRALPEAFAKVDERWHSPTNAIMATAIVAILGCAAESGVTGDIPILGPMLGTGVNTTDILDGIFFTIACISAIILPTKLKDVYERSAWRPKIGSREAVVVVGWIALIMNIYLDLAILGDWGLLDQILIDGEAIPFVPPLIPVLAGGLIPDFSLTGTTDGLPNWIVNGTNWAFVFVLLLVIMGIIIYFVMKNYYSKRGVDFSTIYATIPPE